MLGMGARQLGTASPQASPVHGLQGNTAWAARGGESAGYRKMSLSSPEEQWSWGSLGKRKSPEAQRYEEGIRRREAPTMCGLEA